MGLFGGRNKNIVVPGYEDPEEQGVEFGGDSVLIPMPDGTTQLYHILDNINYEDEQYMILISDEDIRESDEEMNFEVTIMRVTEVKVNEDFEPEFELEPVTDKKVTEAVFDIFQDHIEVE